MQYWLNGFWDPKNCVHLLTLLPWVILFRHPLLCSESLCKQNTGSWKEEGSCLLVQVGTYRMLGWAPECSVLLIKGCREEALALISPWNWLMISLVEFLSPDSLIFFHTVLYLFRSMFFLLNFQAPCCLYLSHHSFFFPPVLISNGSLYFVTAFLQLKKIFSKVWAKNTWLCHFRVSFVSQAS